MNTQIAIREQDGSFSRDDPGTRPFYSISKTFIAASVLQLGIDIERPASDWLGTEWLPGGRQMRLRHLLTHSAGLKDYGVLPAYAQAVTSGQAVWSDEVFATHTLLQPRLFEPGGGFAYSNPGYWVIKRILELETGKPLAMVIRNQVLDPLGLEDTRVVDGEFDPNLPGYQAGWVWHGLLTGSAADAARFMASDLVKPLLRQSVRVPGSHPHWNRPRYALGLMIETGERYGHNGGGPGYSTACYRFESSGRTICVLQKEGSEESAMTEAIRLNNV